LISNIIQQFFHTGKCIQGSYITMQYLNKIRVVTNIVMIITLA